jgi:hypothetical protein
LFWRPSYPWISPASFLPTKMAGSWSKVNRPI